MQAPDKLPSQEDYKRMSRTASEILLSNEDALSKIDGIVSFGIGISKRNWKKVVIQFTMSNKLDILTQTDILRNVMGMSGITSENIEFNTEAKKSGKHTAYGNERIRADKPK
jgi:hypothetical protein